MRVNRGRLDLWSLEPGRPCVITTGLTSVTLTHGSRSVETGLYLKGVGPLEFPEKLILASDGRDRGGATCWLLLEGLSPHRLYKLKILGWDETGWPSVDLADETPEFDQGANPPDEPQISVRTMIDRILWRNR